jgi:hypothetical protein
MKKLFLLILFGVVLTSITNAQSIELTEQQIPPQGSFAQPFQTRFQLTHTPGYQVVLDKETLPKDFALSQEKTEILSPQTLAYELTFLPFTLGASTFTAVTFQLQDNQGKAIQQIQSAETQVKIEPVQFFKDKKMRDIRPPYIPSSWLWWLLALLVLIALVVLIKRISRKVKQHTQEAALKPDNRPAHVIALSKINLLLQSGLWENQQYKLFYIELGDILREYFWRRFGLDVSADTSTELLRHARAVPELAPLYAELRDYLKSADLVKFAKYTPDEDTMHKDVGIVQKTVQKTIPTPTADIVRQEER